MRIGTSAPDRVRRARATSGAGTWVRRYGKAAGLERVLISVTTTGGRDRSTARLGWTALGCAAFVGLAVVLEVVSGRAANSPVPAWADEVAPLGWARPLRVVWWLVVATAALGFRAALHRLGFRQRPVVVVLSVAPFMVFAAGVALGADWATWH